MAEAEHKTLEETQKEEPAKESAKDPVADCEALELYTMETCGHCKRLKSWLDQEKVPYENHNIMEDKQAHMDFVQKYQMNRVPFVVCGDKTWVGFKEQYKEEFKAPFK